MAIWTDRSASTRRRLHQFAADLPVGQKLVSGFAAITLVLLALVGGLFVSVHRLGDAHQQLAGPASMLSQSADRVRYAAGELRAAQQAYVLDSGESRGSFSDASRRFEVALAVLRSSVIDSVDAALVDKIAAGYQTFVVTDEMAWEALQAHDVVLARNLTLGPEGLAFGFMTDDASKLTERASEQRMGASAEFANASRDAQLLGLTMAAVAIVFVVAASRVITRLIRDPLQRVQQVAELAAGGDLNAHVVVSSDDETGRLGRSFNTMLERLRNREHALRVDHRRQELAGQIHRAFEIADDEDAALDVVGRAMATITDDRPAELLLADNSKAHLHRAVVSGSDPHGPGCMVESPFSCAAVRNGTAMSFASSESLDACPQLRGRPYGACSAVCVPVTFMGRAMGVLHTVGADGDPPSDEESDALTMLSTQTGARIGMLRSMHKTQTQAATDGLTGLMNRRTFETRARALHRTRSEFTLAMADLDHFKIVNDTYGHDAGDRALRLFSEVVTATFRERDLIARWGGEEFAFALLDTAPSEAKVILDRVRLELAARLGNGDLRPFTVSFGLVAAASCETLDQAIRLADVALYEAKDQGRDRVVIADNPGAVETRPLEAHAAHRRSIIATLAQDDDPSDY